MPLPTSLALLLLLALAAAAEEPRWQPLGEPGSGGWMVSARIDPRDGAHIVVGGDMLGVHVSFDRGATWTPGLGLPSWECADITFDPVDPATVWIGTLSGPCRSRDGGRTWTAMREGMGGFAPGGYSSPVQRVLFDPADAAHLWAFGGNSRRFSDGHSRYGAVWESRDGGGHWTRLATLGAAGQLADPAAKGANLCAPAIACDGRRLLCGAAGAGIYASDDGGRTWTLSNQGLVAPGAIERVVTHPRDPQVAWACVNRADVDGRWVPGSIYRSGDGGRSWSEISFGLSRHVEKNWNLTAGYKGFAVSESDPQVMVTADISWRTGVIYLSRDGGAHWEAVATKGNIGNEDLADPAAAERRRQIESLKVDTAYFAGLAPDTFCFDPADAKTCLGLGAEFAVLSRDGGATWSDVTATCSAGAEPIASSGGAASAFWSGRGQSGLCSMDFAFDPRDPQRSALVAMDAGKLWISVDGRRSWAAPLIKPQPWGGGRAVVYAGDAIYATTGQFGGYEGVGRSLDRGRTWRVLAGNGLPEPGSRHDADGIHALPGDPAKVWVVLDGRLLASSDAGEHWTEVPEVGRNRAGRIAGDPRDPRRFVVTCRNNAMETVDAGATWRPIGGPRVAGRAVIDGKGRVLVAAYRGPRPGLWRWDAGTWTRLRDDPMLSNVAVDPTDPTRIAVCSNDDPWHDRCAAPGVMASCDDGATWAPLGRDLPMRRGWALAISPHDGETVVFGSQGAGFFTLRWPHGWRPDGGERLARTPEAEAQDAELAAIDDGRTPRPVALANGGMEDGGAAPSGWSSWDAVVISRDTAEFKTGEASLRAVVAGGSGNVSQPVQLEGGRAYTVRAWLRSAGAVKVNLALMSFDDDGKGGWIKPGFEQAAFVSGDCEWTAVERVVHPRAGARHFTIGIQLEGSGSAWLDGVRISTVPEH